MSFLNDPTVEHKIDAQAYARAVSEHVEDCNWDRACELQYEYNLKNPEAPWDPYWIFALILLLTSNKDGFSLKEKEDETENN